MTSPRRQVLLRVCSIPPALLAMPAMAAGQSEFKSTTWSADWVFGVFLILLTVLINVSGLGLIGPQIVRRASGMFERHHPTLGFLIVVCSTTLLATSLHAIDAGIWAFAYRLLGALPDFRSAMLYSLNAMTSYGHTSLALEDHWRLMGAMEALNGSLLFGLSTAFLFGVIHKVWILGSSRDDR